MTTYMITVDQYRYSRKAQGPRTQTVQAMRDQLAYSQAQDMIGLIRSVAQGNKATKAEVHKALGFKDNGNSKVPGSCVSFHPVSCHRGAKLAQVKGSICEGCYAENLARFYAETDIAWRRNDYVLEEALANPEFRAQYIALMAQAINQASASKAKRGKAGAGLHRWFDSGDLRSAVHLDMIVAIAELTPSVRHWLPTREVRLVVGRKFPSNLLVRVSDDMINSEASGKFTHTSGVHTDTPSAGAYVCPATTNAGACGDCTACWDKSVARISYKKH